jgi:hypothetical protein
MIAKACCIWPRAGWEKRIDGPTHLILMRATVDACNWLPKLWSWRRALPPILQSIPFLLLCGNAVPSPPQWPISGQMRSSIQSSRERLPVALRIPDPNQRSRFDQCVCCQRTEPAWLGHACGDRLERVWILTLLACGGDRDRGFGKQRTALGDPVSFCHNTGLRCQCFHS